MTTAEVRWREQLHRCSVPLVAVAVIVLIVGMGLVVAVAVGSGSELAVGADGDLDRSLPADASELEQVDGEREESGVTDWSGGERYGFHVTQLDEHEVEFTWEPEEPFVGEEVTFDASDSSRDWDRYSWDFGDGETGEGEVVTHTYDEAGDFTVRLNVRDQDGAQRTSSEVSVSEAQEPNAEFTRSAETPFVGEEATFDASDSTSPNGDIVEYRWDFGGDGEFDVVTDEPTTTWTFEESGGTFVALQVEDERGQTDFAGAEFSVQEPADPTAAFGWQPEEPVTGEEIIFDASDSVSPDGDIVEYRWEFGDGATQTTSEPETTHTYDEAGDIRVTLTVEDEFGQTDLTADDVRVQEPEDPTAAFDWDPGEPIVDDVVTFDASDSTSPNGDIVEYRWDFGGDGEFDVVTDEPTTTWTFEEPGGTFVALQVEDEAEQADSTGAEFAVQELADPTAAFDWEPDQPVVGEQVTFDASDSVSPDGTIVSYEWDFTGDGSYDEQTADAETTQAFDRDGVQVVGLRVTDSNENTDTEVGEVPVSAAIPDADARCTVSPETVLPGEDVTIDASESSGQIADFDFNGNGTWDVRNTRQFVQTTSYGEPGEYTPRVRVQQLELEQYDTITCTPVVVEERTPPTAAFDWDPVEPVPGETVTFDASASTAPDGTIVEYRWDFTGDAAIDVTTTDPVAEYTFDDPGAEPVTLVVVDEAGLSDNTTDEIRVVRADTDGVVEDEDDGTDTGEEDETDDEEDEDEGIPWIPIGLGGIGMLGLGGLLYYFVGPGGSGTSTPRPTPSLPDRSESVRYETGTFELPPTSSVVSVDTLGFEPDVVLLRATNGHRSDDTTDRTAGWSYGTVHVSDDGIENSCLTVADDARSTDQATAATTDEHALDILRHGDGVPGRIQASVTDTSSDGFEVNVSIPGDDPTAGGIRVLYQAIRTGPASVEVGHTLTPTEPGTQTIDLGIDADHVEFVTSSAVTDLGRTFTTDRAVGLSVGRAVTDSDGNLDSTARAASCWPGSPPETAAACDDDHVLNLLYQDGERVAGRLRAAVTSLGETIRLRYGRVYSGPNKLGSTSRHVLTYLAVDGGEDVRPAIGSFALPRPGKHAQIDIGFEPAMVEFELVGAKPGREIPSRASAQPFGWSHGTAIGTDGTLRQYLLHGGSAPKPGGVETGLAGSNPVSDVQPTAAGTAAADGGQWTHELPTADPGFDDEQSPADGYAAAWLVQAADGTIVARDELAVEALTEHGFECSVSTVSTDRRSRHSQRPTVIYRAWPAADADRQEPAAKPRETRQMNSEIDTDQRVEYGETDAEYSGGTADE